DIERVKQLSQKREPSRITPLEKRPAAQIPQTARREPVVREHLDPSVSRQTMRMSSLRILQELRQASKGLEISSVHQEQLQRIEQRIKQGSFKPSDLEALQKIRKSNVRKREFFVLNFMNSLVSELEFCLGLWEKQGFCHFGSLTKCEECAAPYLILKLINGQVLHGKEMKRLTLKDWKKKLEELKK
ncbi:MAG: hypothetical protein Q7R70_03725, partial [Candidatus Diapherotrites archaeon]|nr:hypothetical protein [Candidatus Diapherotrites archaeon]